MSLGAVRDSEVLLERLRERSRRPARRRRTVGSVAPRTSSRQTSTTMRKKLLADLGSTRYVDLLERLVAAAHAPATLPEADQPAVSLLPALASTPWRRLRSAVRQLPENPADPELHRIRILAKRARYAAEAVAPVAGSGAEAFARAAAKLQTVLGEHQDSVTAQAWLRSARVTGPSRVRRGRADRDGAHCRGGGARQVAEGLEVPRAETPARLDGLSRASWGPSTSSVTRRPAAGGTGRATIAYGR